MVQNYVPQLIRLGEVTVQDIKRQRFEQDLTRSNWRYFYATEETGSPLPGTGRRDDEPKTEQTSKTDK